MRAVPQALGALTVILLTGCSSVTTYEGGDVKQVETTTGQVVLHSRVVTTIGDVRFEAEGDHFGLNLPGERRSSTPMYPDHIEHCRSQGAKMRDQIRSLGFEP